MAQHVFVNRTLNLKKIRYIGFDMDHTLIRYHGEAFEELSFQAIKDKLIAKGYPEAIRALKFNFQQAIRGLAIDKKRGNLLKLNRHSAIRSSYHGLRPIDFREQNRIYQSTYIDLNDPNYEAIDTIFSISHAVMVALLVDLKESQPGLHLPDFSVIADDVLAALDEAHRDGSIKGEVRKRLNQFIIKEPEVVAGLEKYKKHGKKLFIVTNSDFHYTKLLLDYAINPFLKEHPHWSELFEFVITLAQKPRFFYDKLPLLKVDMSTGLMSNFDAPLQPGVYQGGCAHYITQDLRLQPDEILYIGDHIYGDILRLKKDCGWRTAMVIEELAHEIDANLKTKPISQEIEKLMAIKEPLENRLTQLMTDKCETPDDCEDAEIEPLQKQISEIDGQIAALIKKQQAAYNPYWGALMRSGNEESYFAYQVERYACVYMPKLADLLAQSPRSYFRAPRRPMPHELIS
ncbi:MAG: HAD-IG family 5'-nucleotidase [Bdellovibrionaceae bacterium]|jgi:HAD superfamily 5'-nucleotidase-like hydrolase|nr:HAD-IG family 5'-nucleotidase [Pseudobdellovibrionaceae bacterium]